jgi:hypothetical protein
MHSTFDRTTFCILHFTFTLFTFSIFSCHTNHNNGMPPRHSDPAA